MIIFNDYSDIYGQVSRSIRHRQLCDIDFIPILRNRLYAVKILHMATVSCYISTIFCAILLLTISGFNKCWINNPKSN